MQLSSFVSEQKLAASRVELKVVDLAVMGDGGLDLIVSKILDANSKAIKQVGNDLGWLSSSEFLL